MAHLSTEYHGPWCLSRSDWINWVTDHHFLLVSVISGYIGNSPERQPGYSRLCLAVHLLRKWPISSYIHAYKLSQKGSRALISFNL